MTMYDNTTTTSPIEPPEDAEPSERTPVPKKRSKLIIALVAGAALMGLGLGAWALLYTPPVTVQGSVMLTYGESGSRYDKPNYVASKDNCWGQGGYSDIQEGAAVTVYGGAGQILGVGSLGAGMPIEKVGCIYSTTIEVSGGEKFYSMEVTHRGELRASADEIEDGKLVVSGTLGD